MTVTAFRKTNQLERISIISYEQKLVRQPMMRPMEIQLTSACYSKTEVSNLDGGIFARYKTTTKFVVVVLCFCQPVGFTKSGHIYQWAYQGEDKAFYS